MTESSLSRASVAGAGGSIPRFAKSMACAVIALSLWSCTRGDLMNEYDPASGASKKDYEGLVGRKGQGGESTPDAGSEPPIPAFQSVLAAPAAPELADTRRVSIAVTETTPVRDIIIELARKAEVDLELDPRISGGVILNATDRPFIDVIERICELAELRFKFDRNVLKVELDDPYLEQYRMDVLNQTRTSTGSISSSTDASSAAQTVGTGSTTSGQNKSESSVNIQSTNNFWQTIGENIGQILTSIQSRRGGAAEIEAGRIARVEDEEEVEEGDPKSGSYVDGPELARPRR